MSESLKLDVVLGLIGDDVVVELKTSNGVVILGKPEEIQNKLQDKNPKLLDLNINEIQSSEESQIGIYVIV